MKKMLSLAVAAALLLSAMPAAAVGPVSASYMHPKSPLRYKVLGGTFSATADVTATLLGVCPPGGAKVKDVVISQAAAGVAGLSWTITPKKSGTSIVTTAGGFTLAAGANKVTNLTNRPVTLSLPTGGTRPILDATKVACAGGEAFSFDVDLVGVYATGTATLSADLASDEKVTLSSHDFVAKLRYATGTATITTAVVGNKLTIAGHDFTAIANGATPTGDEWAVGTGGTADADSATALSAAINGSTTEGVAGVVQASADAGVVTVIAWNEGAAGNAITFTRTGAPIAVSGSGTLAGAYDPASDEWPIGATLAASASSLSAAINASVAVGTSDTVTCAAAEAVVTCTSRTDGTAGNAITWAKTGDHVAVSGAGTFTGGTNYTTAVTGSLELYLEPNW